MLLSLKAHLGDKSNRFGDAFPHPVFVVEEE